jgi:serine protease inhibitor
MAVREKYRGQEQVHDANGAGTKISHIGQSLICTPHKNLKVKNISHAPSTSKNLLSVHHLTLDNNIFIKFHPWFFLIKDQVTKRVLFRGRCRRGLYHLVPQD